MKKEELLKEYEEWCVKNKKDPLSTDSVTEFKKLKDKKAKAEEDDKAKRRKEIFMSICDYAGVKCEWNENYSMAVDAVLTAFALAYVESFQEDQREEIISKLFN